MLTATVTTTGEATSNWLSVLTFWVDRIDSYVWGLPLIIFVLGTGVLLSWVLRFRHVLNLRQAFRFMFHRENSAGGEVSQFGSLCTALSATIGTGNIVGVATAVGTGGPGALFWMEVAAFFGMATKYAEGLLAVKYRVIKSDGSVIGGPFYYIERALAGKFGIPSWRYLARAFAVFGIGAGIMGIGTITQIHGITSAVQRFFSPEFNRLDQSAGVVLFGSVYPVPVVVAGIFVGICVALVVIGGLKRISAVSTVIVPFMAVSYVFVVMVLLVANADKIPGALAVIFRAAFDPAAVTGGAVGSMFIAMQRGIARGIFSNEAGLGSAPIAAAAAKTDEPVRQGLVCMTGTFIDTIVICTMTGLAIVVTGAWEPSLGLKGVDITVEAFHRGYSFLGPCSEHLSAFFLMISLSFFAFTTILGWNYYSEKCLEYLIGSEKKKQLILFRIVYVAVVFVGPYLTVTAVWGLADIFNGLMAFPNLIALVLLSPVVGSVTAEYFKRKSTVRQKQ